MHNGAEKLSMVTGTLILACVLTRFLESSPLPLVRVTVLGSPIGLNTSARDLMLLIILGLTITAVSFMIEVEAAKRENEVAHRTMYWILPGLLNVGLAAWLNRIGDPVLWAAAVLICAVVIPIALRSELDDATTAQVTVETKRWRFAFLVHLAAALFFTLIFEARARSLLSASAVALVTLLLGARLLWRQSGELTEAWRNAGVAALIVGQITWGLNYWRLSGLQGGLLLLLAFYVVVGLIQQIVNGQFGRDGRGRQILLEYLTVVILTMILIVFAG